MVKMELKATQDHKDRKGQLEQLEPKVTRERLELEDLKVNVGHREP